MSPFEAAARRAAERAGEILRKQWHRRNPVVSKSTPIDLVTETDRACEEAILEVLGEAFPDHAVLAEESGARGEGEYRWLVDPLDGTTNFAHGYPQVAVSLALVRGAQTVFGLVYDPIRDETYCASRGGGASCNRQPIRVTDTTSLATSLLATGFPYDRTRYADFYLSYFKAFMTRTHGLRRAGSAALDLCWVAAGRVDGFWEWRLKPWDTAAGAILVEEAGGQVSDFSGGRFDSFGEQCLATNGRIHGEVLEIMKDLVPCPW
jgi:myo-inositol-1(or 4)-monophosphatase